MCRTPRLPPSPRLCLCLFSRVDAHAHSQNTLGPTTSGLLLYPTLTHLCTPFSPCIHPFPPRTGRVAPSGKTPFVSPVIPLFKLGAAARGGRTHTNNEAPATDTDGGHGHGGGHTAAQLWRPDTSSGTLVVVGGKG